MERSDLHIEVEDYRLVVSLPDTNLRAVFFKPQDRSALRQSPGMSIDSEASKVTRHDFEELAWETATAKARGLGWI